MNNEVHEQIRDLLKAWSDLDPQRVDTICLDVANIMPYDVEIELDGKRVIVYYSAKLYSSNSEYLIQAAIREACDEIEADLETVSYSGIEERLHDVLINTVYGGNYEVRECSNLTLAMLECWLELLKGERDGKE